MVSDLPNSKEDSKGARYGDARKNTPGEGSPKAAQGPRGSATAKEDPEGDQAIMPHTAESAGKLVEEVASGVKSAIQEAVAWTEKQVNKLSEADDTLGPYTSPATCPPSDLDPIASGILPALPNSEKLKENNDDEQSKKSRPEPNAEHGGTLAKQKTRSMV